MSLPESVSTYPEASEYLDTLYHVLNRKYFNGELLEVVLTIQSSPKTYGHFTPYDAWISENGSQKEINVSAGSLDRPIVNVVCTLLHEMTHFYCHINNIKDVSRGNVYHNKRFKTEAEKRGLLISYSDRYGWTVTEPSKDLWDWVKENRFPDIHLARKEEQAGALGTDGDGTGKETGDDGPKNKRTSTRKYYCPVCGCSVRATKVVNILCMDCDMQMITDDDRR